jgi:hypothetical protein
VREPRLTSTLLAFIAVQCADAYLTVVGIARFGFDVEANPILAWYVTAFGAGTALIGAKTVAVACAATLWAGGRQRTLAVLTVLYVVAAIVPWMLALKP